MKSHRHELLHRRRGTILRISYALAIGMVILAFQWQIPVKERTVQRPVNDELTFLDFTLRTKVQETTPLPEVNRQPVQPITATSNIVAVVNTKPVAIVPFQEPDLTQTLLPNGGPATQDIVMDNIYRTVQEMPEFPGGLQAFYAYLAKAITYPAMDRENDIEGTVHIQFVVEKDGSISHIEILRGATSRMNEEAIAALAGSPRWKPGKQQGMAVRVYYVLPIYFRL